MNVSQSGITRRDLLRATGIGISLTATAPLLTACGGLGSEESSGNTSKPVLKIGFVSPRTGAAAGFGEPDAYVLDLAKKALAGGLSIGGTQYEVQILDRDSQSNPQRSAQVANDLINGDAVDLMLTTSTPETVNPVSDACEAAGVPCVSTVVPWQAWYFGRGAKPEEKNAYKFTYHFCFGVEQFHNMYTHEWPQVPTNKKVGVMWPNDSDGNAIRAALGPLLTKSGYTIVDPGAYTSGTNDYSAQIALFKRENCEIFNTFPIPPDFATFWRQAAQQGYQPKICQVAKTGLFPSQIEALGPIGLNIAGGAYWAPWWPYKSSLTGVDSKALGDGYQAAGKQWNQQLGPSLALFDVAAAAFQAVADPKDKAGVAKAIGSLSIDTPVGKLEFGKGPNANVVTAPILGGQWIKSTDSRYQVEFVQVENSSDPNVPVAAKLLPYR
ncbi:ABC transporter substrate-binding protein [Paractinoplanes rishiriensis]|uniref:ABC transporter substrate-binding protein n=1 Tax=Paractinoplanes rishiriensis TaxID=1050105 RepID=A0A919K3G8_9ACTN|nr:ABC transporter substrate-binding protein [Actinoplanes rishiriensis]GIE98582.1 ABC transporter substrate-binding protein [Actinoplanes rishiriensis]